MSNPPQDDGIMADKCDGEFANFIYERGKTYCNNVHDKYLCWPPTPAGEIATQNCPETRHSDATKIAFRECGTDGTWLGRGTNSKTGAGWTNYTACFPELIQTLITMVNGDPDSDHARNTLEIARITRLIEIIGYSFSLGALITALFIFIRYQSLHNGRTHIHKCLFSTMIVQFILRLTIYSDQALVRQNDNQQHGGNITRFNGIENTSYLCETSYILLEYTIGCMFMWKFVETVYLHNMVTGNARSDSMPHALYYIVGWGLPVITTAVWAIFTALHYMYAEIKVRCWFGYNLSRLYWIIQGPRLTVLVVNFLLLIRIMRVVVVKLRRSATTELEMIKKAARAALILLPLLGLTNVMNMFEPPPEGNLWKFAMWSIISHFLCSFQGLFLAIILCFLNAEVQQVVKRHYKNFKMKRAYRQRRRRGGQSLTNNSMEMATIMDNR